MITLVNMFCDSGCSVDLIVMNNQGPLKSNLDAKVNKIVLKEGGSRVIGRAVGFNRLKKYMKEGSCDVMLSTIRNGNIF
jgi:hypothetical protein